MKSEKEIKKYIELNQGKDASPYDSENTILVKELEAILEAAGQLDKPEFDKKKVFSKIKKTINEGDKQKPKPKTVQLYRWVSGIASIIVLIIIGVYFINNDIDVYASDELLTHILPDQSEVFLDHNSTISYNKDFATNRELQLAGEAFFEVEEGSTFSVITEFGQVSVLGTSFNVYARNNTFIVGCKTGKVKVDIENNSYTLTPGNQVRLHNKEVIESTLNNVNSINAWINDQPYFESTPLSIVIDKLSNHYNTKIELPSEYRDLLFTGSYDTKDFNKAIKMVLLPMEIEYKIKPNQTISF